MELYGLAPSGYACQASENVDYYVQKAQKAEEGKFDMVFLADVSHIGPGMIPHYLSMFEGISILSALSMATSYIGLTATIATSYADPFTVGSTDGFS